MQALAPEKYAVEPVEVPVQVMVDGPYGGCSVDLGQYETAILFAGGAGITFTLGLLDDIVGRCVRKGRENGERTRRIEFSWCVRSFGKFPPLEHSLSLPCHKNSQVQLNGLRQPSRI
jgi:predicted ferric reductase